MMVDGANSHLESNPFPSRDAQRAQTNLLHTRTQGSYRDWDRTMSVSCGATVPFSWVLVHKVLLSPPRVYFPVLCKSGSSMVGLMATSSKRAYATPTPEPLSLRQTTADSDLHRRRSNSFVSVSVGSLGPGAQKVCLSPLSISGRNGV